MKKLFKRFAGLAIAIVLIISCISIQAAAETEIQNTIKRPGPGGPATGDAIFTDAVVIPLDDRENQYGIVGICPDGRLKTIGDLPEELAEELENWKDIIQFGAFDIWLIGLQKDGKLQITKNLAMRWYEDPNEVILDTLKTWSDIRQLAFSIHHIFGLKADGTLAVAGPNYFAGDEMPDFSVWTNLCSICAGSSEDGGFVIGVRNDGTILEEGIYDWTWYGTPKKVTAVSCSGWQLLCLNGNGTVVSTGLDAMPEGLQWTDIVQLCAGDCFAAGLKKDGSVVAHAFWDMDLAAELETWQHVQELYLGQYNLTFGIQDDGHVLVSRAYAPLGSLESFADMIQTVEGWQNIAHILWGNEQHVLALRADGKLETYELPAVEIG